MTTTSVVGISIRVDLEPADEFTTHDRNQRRDVKDVTISTVTAHITIRYPSRLSLILTGRGIRTGKRGRVVSGVPIKWDQLSPVVQSRIGQAYSHNVATLPALLEFEEEAS